MTTASKKPVKNPVTPSARDAFMLYMKHWQEQFGLHDWRIVLSDKLAPKANMADVDRDYVSRLARVRLGADFGATPVDDASLEDTAMHEIGHIFLHELMECRRDENVPEDVVQSVEHRVIHTIVGLLNGKGRHS